MMGMRLKASHGVLDHLWCSGANCFDKTVPGSFILYVMVYYAHVKARGWWSFHILSLRDRDDNSKKRKMLTSLESLNCCNYFQLC